MDGTADVKRAKEEISELENISEEISRIKNRRKKGWKYRRKGQRKRCMWLEFWKKEQKQYETYIQAQI